MNDKIKQKVYQKLGVDINWLKDLPNTEITYPIKSIGTLVDFIVDLAKNEKDVEKGWREIIRIQSKIDGSTKMNVPDGFSQENVKICFETILKEIKEKGINFSQDTKMEIK